jgi:hypothetical protein
MNNTSNTNPVLSVKLTGSDQVIANAKVFLGATLINESGASARFHVHNGSSGDAANPIIAGLSQATLTYGNVWYGPNGIACPNGVFVDAVAGTFSGSVFYR